MADARTSGISTTVLNVSDVEIGAVEIKNSTTDDRATVDALGNVYVKTYLEQTFSTFSVAQSSALEKSHIVKASSGTLYKVTGRIDATAASATYYFQLINASSLPADGAVTLLMTPLKIIFNTGADYLFNFDFTGDITCSGLAAGTGIVAVVSTTEFTKTIVASNILSMSAFYK